MKNRVLCMLFVGALLFSGCTKANAQQSRTDADVSILTKVLASLSDACRNSIKNGDAGEFLADLQHVLEADEDDLLILCDKKHPVGSSYAPSDLIPLVKGESYTIARNDLSLRKPAYESLKLMAEAARKDGITLLASSTYRSYAYQTTVYNRLVKLQGQEITDRESARPGTSQHQLGTVVDFGSIDDSFAKTKACQWLNKHASEYGWSLSFPDGYEEYTGYRWECWHFRYIGEKACAFQEKWFGGIQQFMLEFIYNYKQIDSERKNAH